MYLAQTKIKGETCYCIRESYSYEDNFLSRDLIDLGPDPARFIIYPGGNSFYIDEFIEDRINELGKKADPDKLEDIFWRFLHPEIRRVLEPFRSREKQHRAGRRKNRPQEDPDARVHIFDKRRTHFLTNWRAIAIRGSMPARPAPRRTRTSSRASTHSG